MKHLALTILLACVGVTNSHATNYFVSPGGNNANDGLNSTTAWASIDNGDQLAVLNPGDTVLIASGTYSLTQSVTLTTFGTEAQQVVYMGYGEGEVIIDLNGVLGQTGVRIEASHVALLYVRIINSAGDGINVNGDSCTIAYCQVDGVAAEGFRIRGHHNLLFRNIISFVGGTGIRIDDIGSLDNEIIGNTVVGASGDGIIIKLGQTTTRIFNNIVIGNDGAGIRGQIENTSGFNNVWSNSGGDYAGGAFDSAGAISTDPLFVGTAAADFSLQAASPCIDAALDLGYPFNGSAPDMGAIEYIPVGNQAPILIITGFKSVNEGQNLNILIGATDPDFTTPTLIAENVPINATFVDSGNGTGSFDFNPDYTQAGVYNVRFIASDGGLADTVIIAITVNNVNRAPVLVAIGSRSVEEGQNLAFSVSATDPDGTAPKLAAFDLPTNATFIDSGNGTGYFSFTPGYAQEGVYSVTFTASDATFGHIEIVEITVTPAPIVSIDVIPDSALVEILTNLQFFALGYDAGSILVKDISDSVIWSISGTAGSVSAVGLFTAGNNISPPVQYVKANFQGSMFDSSQVTIIASGSLSYIRVEWASGALVGDTFFTTDYDSAIFYCRGYNSADGLLGNVSATWSIIGVEPIGTVSPTTGTSTTLELTKIGSGKIIATHDFSRADTTGIINVSSGSLANILISPDFAIMGMDDSIQFAVTGFDLDSNITDAGQITWKDIGRVGSIDMNGLFISTSPGLGRVTAVSSLGAVVDTSGLIDVQELYVSTIPIGNGIGLPGENRVQSIVFTIHNYFNFTKSITGVTIHDASTGLGTVLELLTNYDSLGLYLDVDNDSSLTVSDSLIRKVAFNSNALVMAFPALDLAADSEITLLVGVDIASYPRDGDTLDLYIVPAVDILTGDGTVLTGPETVNSFGIVILDGMVSSQLETIPVNVDTITPGDTLYHLMTLDIPRNGYETDLLTGLSVINLGTAVTSDIDSLLLFIDDGDGIWEGRAIETLVGRLVYTGSRWSLSGLSSPLTNLTTRFFVAVRLAAFPKNLRTILPAIPIGGIEVSSGNDGPLFNTFGPIDSITIKANQEIAIAASDIATRTIYAGRGTGPIFGFELANSFFTPFGIDSIRLSFVGVDPSGATQLQLDSQIDSLQLSLRLSGPFNIENPDDSVIATGVISNGQLVLNTPGLVLASSGGNLTFSVEAFLNATTSRNNNLIGYSINDQTSIYFSQPVTIIGTFPVTNSNMFTIDAFPEQNITINTLSNAVLSNGMQNQPILDIVLPGNGYASDVLTSFRVENIGTLMGKGVFTSVKLWEDVTGNGFTVDDIALGQLFFKNGGWELNNFVFPINAAGRKCIVTAAITGDQRIGGTVQMQIPVGGCKYLSGMTGPDDVPSVSSDLQILFPIDRITVISVPEMSSAIFPFSTDHQLMTFALYNGHIGSDQTLNGIKLTNRSLSKSGLSYGDFELGLITLHHDIDNNRTMSNDPIVASGVFVNGVLNLSGLNVLLPAESLTYFFVHADVPLELIDSDSLTVTIEQPSDFVFSAALSVNGDLPLDNGAYLIVDGSIAIQYKVIDLPQQTMSPLDTSVVLYAFSPAVNGNLPDSLQSLTIVNSGLADTADLGPLELWMDSNADEVWQSTDQFLGLFNYASSQWTIGSLNLLVDTTGATLFVLADVRPTASPGRNFHGEIPINGCQYSSGNDGPLDLPLVAKHGITISTSGIQVSVQPLISSFSVGQTIKVSLTVTNLLAGTIDSVFGMVVGISDSSLVTLDSSSSGPVTLAPGTSTGFDFYYTANQIGVESWLLRAVAPNLPDSSEVVRTDSVQIQAPPTVVTVQLVNSIPTSVIRGQTNVFPLSIQYDHPDTANTAAGLRLDSLRLRVEDGSGNAIAASSVASRMAILSGATILTELTSIPGQSDVTMVFNQPVILGSGGQQSYTLLVDINILATAGIFALAIENASAVPLVDENTLQPVSLDPGIAFPLRTASSRIDDPARELAFSATSLLTTNVNYGQRDVATLQLNIRHPGSSGSSQIQLTSLSFSFLDSLGSAILLSDLLDEIKIRRQQVTIGELALGAFDTTVATLPLSLPLTLGPGEIDSFQITVSVRQTSLLTGFSLLISDSTQFVVRDLSSGSLLEAVTDTITLATGILFPINSGWAVLKQPATAPNFCIASILPGSITGGTDSLGLITLSFDYPVSSDQSPLRLFSVLVNVQDTLNRPLDPDRLFDRIGFKTSTSSLTYQPFVELQSGAALFKFSDSGLIIAPGDSVEIQLFADIEADAPFDHFVLEVTSEIDLVLSDATDSTNIPGLISAAGCTTTFPFVTNVTEIFLPAGEPSLSVTSFPTQIAFRGQFDVSVFAALLSYTGTNPQGDIVISEIVGTVQRRTGTGLIPVNGATVFGGIHLQIDNQFIASDTSLDGDTVRLSIPSGYNISPGENLSINLTADILLGANPGNYVIKFQDSTFLKLADENLGTPLFAALVNESYPMFTVELSVTEANLEQSFSNFPNPFHPSLGEFTTFAYVLSEAAQVDIDIFSITGEAVKRVTINAARAAGPHQEDTWYGVNDRGLAVMSGTYYCRITARYNSGRIEVFRRKAAVVR